MNRDSQEDHTAVLSAEACSVELFVHQLLLCLVLLPFTLLVFPFLTFHVGVSLLNLNLSADWRQWKGLPSQSDSALLNDTQEIVAAVALTMLALLATGFRYWRSLQRQKVQGSERRYRAFKGNGGTALKERIANLWSKVASQRTATPEALWFPSAGVLAHTMVQDGKAFVAVSTGLWERIESDDPIVEIVLLHELAHLAYKDPIRFARFNALLQAANRTLALLLRILAFIIIFLMVQQLILNLRAHLKVASIFRQELMIASIGAIALSLCPVAAAIIRRYMGFITSLVELRADVRAAQWAGGLSRFADVLKAHPLVHRSTLSDRARSWFSLDLTHLSETERIEIVSAPQRLLTPKIEYFIFSLALALLLPLNGLTPLFEGGIFDLAAVVAVAVALMCAVSAMLVLAGESAVRVSLGRLILISAALTLFVAATRINLYTLTYSLSTVVVEVGLPPNGPPLSGSRYLEDIVSAFHDIRDQLLTIWERGWLLVSILISTTFVTGALSVSRRLRAAKKTRRWLIAIVAGLSGLGVIVDGYDHWRAFVVEESFLGKICQNWADFGTRFPGVRFTLGPCIALIVLSVLLVPFFRTVGRSSTHES